MFLANYQLSTDLISLYHELFDHGLANSSPQKQAPDSATCGGTPDSAIGGGSQDLDYVVGEGSEAQRIGIQASTRDKVAAFMQANLVSGKKI
ncbi:hypothetical protein Tco_0486791 [Tanacetum coccineum]